MVFTNHMTKLIEIYFILTKKDQFQNALVKTFNLLISGL